jgi:hypothetical protein
MGAAIGGPVSWSTPWGATVDRQGAREGSDDDETQDPKEGEEAGAKVKKNS